MKISCFASTGDFPLTVTVSDADGKSVETNHTTVDVTAAALTDTTSVTTANAFAGGTGPIVLATFTDGNPNAQDVFFNPVVDWGGTVIGTPAVSVQLVSWGTASSTWDVVGSAAYAETGTYIPTVTVSDGIGNTVETSNTTLGITDAPLTDTTPVATVNAVEGAGTGPVVLATFTDGNPDAQAAYFTPVVNWGGSVIGDPAASVQLVSQGTNNSTWEVVGNTTYVAETGELIRPTVTVERWRRYGSFQRADRQYQPFRSPTPR